MARRQILYPAALVLVFLIAVSLSFYYFRNVAPPEAPVYEEILQNFPDPEQLPPPNLPLFRFDHPRLPHPSGAEIVELNQNKPGFLARHKLQKNVRSRILTAFLDPNPDTVDAAYETLVKLPFGFRANSVRAIAAGYDWLYPYLNQAQREKLLAHLLDGCDAAINTIRGQRLSPYNVFLYNSPFQSLIACSLASYGDDPRATPMMSFAEDFWKKRVLPVWDQVMGRNGGWHEGGEYVGIGIGQAVYSVPAMWRSATGEDLFDRHPGIAGFLDFLVHRNRPDNTDIRWGDAANFQRSSPDRLPLAIETGHREAYSLRGCPKPGIPSSWPWGPITTDTLCIKMPDAKRYSTARLLDGTGLLLARSDWSDSATFVSFKAGDNFWSHSNLDQGSFTIFSRGPLIIDSGLYGPRYGADHHINYTYQTIAHNTITVTDPDDNHPLPMKEKGDVRLIANDGGQRRVGSGWGLEAAPIDLAEWQAKSSIYHTARLIHHDISDERIVMVADLTPAYTNERTGSGTFSARTRRVEHLFRSFVYDRVNQLVIIRDRLQTSSPELVKKFLLHMVDRPSIAGTGFVVHSPVSDRDAPDHSFVAGQALFPEEANLSALGGPGFEFFVDGVNYDEGGDVHATAKRKGNREIGDWRLEISPSLEAAETDFLVVLHITDRQQELERPLDIRAVADETRIGASISVGDETLTWWFDRNGDGLSLDNGSGLAAYRFEPAGLAAGQ